MAHFSESAMKVPRTGEIKLETPRLVESDKLLLEIWRDLHPDERLKLQYSVDIEAPQLEIFASPVVAGSLFDVNHRKGAVTTALRSKVLLRKAAITSLVSKARSHVKSLEAAGSM